MLRNYFLPFAFKKLSYFCFDSLILNQMNDVNERDVIGSSVVRSFNTIQNYYHKNVNEN